jgi:hypothetical protein
MCTSIVEIVEADGAGKGEGGWFDLTHSVVSYDHPHHALFEEAINIDFVNPALGAGARVAVELSLEAAKELSSALARAIAQAEIEEGARLRNTRAVGRRCDADNRRANSPLGKRPAEQHVAPAGDAFHPRGSDPADG